MSQPTEQHWDWCSLHGRNEFFCRHRHDPSHPAYDERLTMPKFSLPQVITPKDLANGQHISVRHNYDQKHSVTYEGLVLRFDEETVTLRGEAQSRWAVNQPKVDVILTLLAEPEPVYEQGQLADVTFNVGEGAQSMASAPVRCFFNDGRWWRVPIGASTMNIPMDKVLLVDLLRIAGRDDVIIPVKDGWIELPEREGYMLAAKKVHEWVDTLIGGLGDEFSVFLAKMFCTVDTNRDCCLKHDVHVADCAHYPLGARRYGK